MLGRRTTYAFLSLVGLGLASYLVLWGVGVFDENFEGMGSKDDLWKLVGDVAFILAAAFAGLCLAFAMASIALALVLRLPLIGSGALWLARLRWKAPQLGDDWVRRWSWRAVRGLGEIAHWLVGYDLVVDDFEPSGSAPGAQVVAVGATSGEVMRADPYDELASEASTVAAAVRSTLGDSGLPTAPGGVDFVRSASGAGPVMTAAADAMREIPELKWLAPLLRLGRSIMPREIYVLHGYLLPPGDRGRGLVLTLAERGAGLLQSETLYERTYDPRLGSPSGDDHPAVTDTLYRLGVGAASWTLYQVLEARQETEAREKLGADNWHSYAYFRAGLLCHEARYPEQARALYVRALERDRGNRLALFNLASINAGDVGRDGRSATWDAAIARLVRLSELIEEEKRQKSWRRCDPLWYQAAYKLGATRLEKATSERGAEADQGDVAAAYKGVRKMLVELEKELDDLPDLEPKETAAARREVLERVEGPALVLFADLALALRHGQSEPSVRCTSGDARKQLIARLEKAEREPRPDKVGSGKMPWLSTYIVDEYLGDNMKRTQLSYRARYNLACYYARKASVYGHGESATAAASEALRELRYGVETGNLAEWATRDPTLGWLREKRPQDFAAVVAPYRRTTDVARLWAVPTSLAMKLERLGIESLDDLGRRGRTRTDREALAKDLGIALADEPLLAGAAALAGRLNGITAEQVNLLQRAGVCMPTALRSWVGREAELTVRLHEFATTDPSLGAAPDRATVEEWLAALGNG